jgi:anaerobic magnesium-protoporphyrin IX monomethyl ester cyclase
LREHGIETGMFLMWGYEGEELSDIEATVEHVKTCRPDIFLTTVSYPIKGTPYYDDVSPKLVRIGEWTASTDRDVRVAGRHSRRFYQFADQLLKSEVAGCVDEADTARRGLRDSYAEVEG